MTGKLTIQPTIYLSPLPLLDGRGGRPWVLGYLFIFLYLFILTIRFFPHPPEIISNERQENIPALFFRGVLRLDPLLA